MPPAAMLLSSLLARWPAALSQLVAMLLTAIQHRALPLTATPSAMMARPNQLGLLSGSPSLNVQGAYMPNTGWQMITQREQMLQDQLQRERQQFEAWKL